MVPSLQNQKKALSDSDLVFQEVALCPGRSRLHLTAPSQALAALSAIEAERSPFATQSQDVLKL